MKNTLYILIISLFLFSCDPPIVCTGTCNGKRIRNIENAGDYFKIEYDSNNQPLTYYKALNEFATFDYNTSLVTKVYDGKTTTYTLDSDGREIASASPLEKASYSYK